MTYTVKEFANMFHATEHTVRYYTDIGLLPCRRDSGNHRMFDEPAVNWMRAITYLKSCGMPIREIKRYFDLCQMEESEENLRARYEIIAKQREAAHKKRRKPKPPPTTWITRQSIMRKFWRGASPMTPIR